MTGAAVFESSVVVSNKESSVVVFVIDAVVNAGADDVDIVN